MRVTVDTNFLVSATQWSYSVAHKLLVKFVINDVQLFTTQAILDEFLKVLVRDFGYSLDESKTFILIILDFFVIVKPLELINFVKADPDDNAILECAVESHSDYIVTYDKKLIEINDFRGIKIVKPEQMFGLLS